MNVRFLSVGDVKNSKYLREGSKNLLLTPAGVSDTAALCGVLKGATDTKYGPNISIDDGSSEPISITAGTFNKKLLKSVEKIIDKLSKNKSEIYLLIYANPYETDRLYLNANYDNSVIEVDEKTFREFHVMRESAGKHLMHKIGVDASKEPKEVKIEKEIEKEIEITEPKKEAAEPIKEISEKEVIKLIKKLDKGRGVKIEDFPEIEDKIYELIEKGELYEPLAGFARVV